MTIETEYKYLVTSQAWTLIEPERCVRIRQGYLAKSERTTVRIRLTDEQAFLTIKGRSKGASRPEFEYEIPQAEAAEMIQIFKPDLVEKTRYYLRFEDHIWEVDVFEGLNAGLILAEIELQAEDEVYTIPSWIGENVTRDKRYANSSLSINPYTSWPQEPKATGQE